MRNWLQQSAFVFPSESDFSSFACDSSSFILFHLFVKKIFPSPSMTKKGRMNVSEFQFIHSAFTVAQNKCVATVIIIGNLKMQKMQNSPSHEIFGLIIHFSD